MPETAPRARAPDPLGLVERFVNTVDLEDRREDLADAAALAAWLSDAGLLDAPSAVDSRALRRAVALREAIRAELSRHAGHPGDPGAIAEINAAAARARLRPVLRPDGSSALEPDAPGVDGALGRIVAAIHAAAADGTWGRLKACERESCRWAFYDQSKNRSGRWCAMGACGNREKSLRAYRRRRARGA